MKSNKIILLMSLFVFVHFYSVFVHAEVISNDYISFSYDRRGISGIASPKDPYSAQVTNPQRPLSLMLRYQVGQGDWQNLNLSQSRLEYLNEEGIVQYIFDVSESPLRVVQTFKINETNLDWDIDIETTTDQSVRIGDLAINIPSVSPSGRTPQQIFENGFMPHQFISGNGSFIYYVRASGAPPFLIVTVKPGTHLEYFSSGGTD